METRYEPGDIVPVTQYCILLDSHDSNLAYIYLPHNTSPLGHLSLLGLRDTHNLVAIEQAKRIKCLLQLPHSVHRFLTQLMRQIIALDESNTMLTSSGSLELNSALDHFVNQVRRFVIVALPVVENNCLGKKS